MPNPQNPQPQTPAPAAPATAPQGRGGRGAPPAGAPPAGAPPAGAAPQGRGAAPPAPPSALALKYPWPAKPTLIGTRVKRIDGRAKYTYDIARPGMLYGKIVRSSLPHARIVSIDTTEAQRAPGVKVVYNVKEPNAQVMYQGDPVVALAADTEERAKDAMRLVKIQYEPLPFVASEAASICSVPVAPAWKLRS